jgi:hypothetical protein
VAAAAMVVETDADSPLQEKGLFFRKAGAIWPPLF